jgi:HEAT repeat protein
MLRGILAPAGRRLVDQATPCLESGLAAVGTGVLVTFAAGRDQRASRTLYEAFAATAEARTPGEIPILTDGRRQLAIDGAEGIELVRTVYVPVEVVSGRLRRAAETVILRRGALVLHARISYDATTLLDNGRPWDFYGTATCERAARIAREALELVRGVAALDPWDGKRGDDAQRALVEALDDPHWGTRWRATRNLARSRYPDIDGTLVRMLSDRDATVRCAALRALDRRGWLAGAAAEERDRLATDPAWEVRFEYLRAVAGPKEMFDIARPEDGRASRLFAALEDPFAGIRVYAFEAACDLGASGRIPWERLHAGVEDVDPHVRIAAICAVDHERDAAEVILGASRDAEAGVREIALDCLRQLGAWSPQVTERVVAAFGDEAGIVREAAAKALLTAIRSGVDATPAVSKLVPLLEDAFCRKLAAEALGRIGVPEPSALRSLGAGLSSPEQGYRYEAARALCRLGGDPAAVAPVFAEMLRRGDATDRADAATGLGGYGRAAEPYLHDLRIALADRSARVRVSAAQALGNLGIIAEGALPDLERAKEKDEDEDVRHAAEVAIGRITLD